MYGMDAVQPFTKACNGLFNFVAQQAAPYQT